MRSKRNPGRKLATLARRALLAASLCGLATAGCHRAQYRYQADVEAYTLLDQKKQAACEVAAPPLRIDISPESRMFDPFDPDFEPMPNDDPQSHRYMHCVDGKRGYPMWHAAGDTNISENPDWWASLPLDERGVLVLDADTAVRLALIHSPEYQQQLETLYLSALDVSTQRFTFDTQFFGGAQLSYLADGPRTAGGSNSQLALQTYNFSGNALEMERRFATGADLLVRFANQVVWEFSGNDNQIASSLLDFTLLQPLLRNAGRDVVLENLTQAERTLLANVRSFERFRRSFYQNVLIGRSLESTPNRNATTIANISTNAFSNAGGFLGLVQTQLQIRNSEENVQRLRESLLILEDSLREQLLTIPNEATIVPNQQLQVSQTRQQLLNQQSGLVTQRANYKASVDAFLATLGLPPYICTEIDDPWLDRFLLITEDLKQRRIDITDLRDEIGTINTLLLDLASDVSDPDTGFRRREAAWNPQVESALEDLRAKLVPIARMQSQLAGPDVARVRRDLETLKEALPERIAHAERMAALYQQRREEICNLLNVPNIGGEIFSVEDLKEVVEEIEEQLIALETRFEEYGQRVHEAAMAIDTLLAEYREKGALETAEERVDLADRIRDDAILITQDLLAVMADDILQLQLLQARARTESVLLPEIDLTDQQAFAIARENRRDYRNARAALVDQWRQIEVIADDLESELDVIVEGAVRTAPGESNPFKLTTDSGQIRVGLRWDAPITRLLERNAYRETLIDYQQARRSFYQFEDAVWQLLRGELRQLEANQINFELQRLQLRNAAEQVGINEDIRVLREARGLSSGPTAARDQIQALSALLNAQNSFLNIYVSYEVLRQGLIFDLGVMELTPDGYWIDPGEVRYDTIGGAAGGAFGVGGCPTCVPNGVILAPAPMDGDVIAPEELRAPIEVVPAPGNASDGASGIIHPQREPTLQSPRNGNRHHASDYQTVSAETIAQPTAPSRPATTQESARSRGRNIPVNALRNR